jgi:hypothetical protein
LGIQLEKLEFYAALRAKMEVKQTPFEHFMLVAGNLPQRCIDGVWVVFGFEPFGFRLCHAYDGSEFCYGIVNPVLKGFSASRLIKLNPGDELLCRPTNRRSSQVVEDGSDDEEAVLDAMKRVASEIGPLRARACDEALYRVHIQPECEGWLVERLRELHAARGFTRVVDLIEARLCSLYPNKKTSSDFRTRSENVLDRYIQEPDNVKTQTVEDVESRNLWPAWLSVFRLALKDLVDFYGLPGGGVFCDAEISANPDAWDQLGRFGPSR